MIQQELLPTSLPVEPPAPDSGLRRKRGPYLVGEELLTLADLAQRAGVKRTTMKRRLRRMTAVEALRRPLRQKHEIKPEEMINGLKVIEEAGRDRRGARRYKIECFCAKHTIFHAAGADVRRGKTKSCGCSRAEARRKGAKKRLQDLTEQTFSDGAVRALRLSDKTRVYRGIKIPLWECLCSWCGQEFLALAADLKRSMVTSCGCHGGRDAKRRAKIPRYPVRGAQLTLADVTRVYGIPRSTMRRRMGKGETPEQIVADKVRSTWVSPVPIRAEVSSYREIDREMEAKLIRRSQAADRVATHTLVMAHDAFLRQVASKWAHHGLGAEFDDILQEERISFLRSLETADPAKGSLITYAGGMATRKAKRAVECDSRTVRVPVHIQQAARHAARCGATTPDEIRELVGCPKTADEVALFMRTKGRSSSLDAPVGDQSGDTWLDLQADDGDSPEDQAAQSERREKLSAALANAMTGMTQREIDVLRRRSKGETLAQIGEVYGVSRERIRQLEQEALRRVTLRAGKDLRELAAG